MSPTANTSPSKSTSARKPARAKAAPKTTAAKRASTSRTPRTAKSTASTARSTASTARRSSTSSARARGATGTIPTVGVYAQRAVLIPVGAALIARDRLLAGVSELPRDPSAANAKAQAQLHKFERRGTSARNSLEREARRTRVRLERELRRRRGELDRAVSDLDKRRNSISRSLTEQVEEASTQIERTFQERVKGATSLAGKVQDRVLDLV